MQPDKKPYRPGHWVVLGTILGTFIGIIFDKLALGMIFGFFIGVMIDSHKKKSKSAPAEKTPDGQSDSLD
ncbi:uncharacterized protein YqgC (DUF456 family) [Rheinheimera pacifica]|uniref:hypothetical protein n=1 Tax=Rheinheimera pacifica TaxID=173990 RepID=UPI002867A853|nr:hypothetical protein [Rheinheimera pacifica]MDR6983032.1 uncharacterized protein YqgC (DUF456 family) [Rheinheimera pacifica]